MKIWLGILSFIVFALTLAVYVILDQGISYIDNSAGLLVGSLSALVTILIGWQIYQIVDISSTKKELNSLIGIATNECMVSLHSNMAMLCNDDDKHFWQTYHNLWELVFLSRNKRFKECKQRISSITKINDGEKVMSYRREALLDLIAMIESPEKISNLNDLESFIKTKFPIHHPSPL